MLVCPQCQFENPNTNKFCQKCGTSLTYKTCDGCSSQVSFSEEYCLNCGASTGTVWQAVISKDLYGQNSVSSNAPEVAQVSEGSLLPIPDPQSPVPSLQYLDAQQRYRLLEPLPPLLGEQIQVRVLDCQPFQKSPLEALVEKELGNSGELRKGDELPSLENSPQSLVPAIAQSYLSLQEEFYPTIPGIHDAWQQDGKTIVLLEDRSKWQQLGEIWKNDQVPMLQILYGLGQMVQLWSALEPSRCRQSLLKVENLRVDEDQMMCLQQLYPEPKDSQLGLKDLGQVWQILFSQSGRTQFTALDQLFRELDVQEIKTVDELRSRLQAIAHELQPTEEIALSEPTPQIPEPVSQIPAPDPDEFILGDNLRESDDLPTVVLPMQLISLEDAGCTDIGRLRDHNEDYFGIQTQVNKQENPIGRTVQARGLYILCDGMGGHAGGEVASVMAVETLKRYFQDHWGENLPSPETIRSAVQLANKAIYDVNQQNARSGSGRMGTTLVMVLVQDTDVAIAHVGDSRLYRLTRKRPLEQITVDHEVGQREIQRGVDPKEAYARPDAYQLTQALGPRDENYVKPDIQVMELNEDTLLLLCSDGLSDHDLLENHWQTHLLPLLSSRANLDQGLLQLIDLGNQHNGHDNITALLVRAKVRPNLGQQL